MLLLLTGTVSHALADLLGQILGLFADLVQFPHQVLALVRCEVGHNSSMINELGTPGKLSRYGLSKI